MSLLKHWCLFLGISLMVLPGCSRWNHSEENFSGMVEITEHLLGPKGSGRVVKLNVDEGSPVKKGDIIAVMDRYDQTKKDYERLAALLKSGGSNQQAVEHARLEMEDQLITSPVDGIVLVKIHDAGEMAPAGSAVVVVGDTGRYWVRVFVPLKVLNRISIGSKAVIHLDGMSQDLQGQVSYVSSYAEFTPRNVQTKEERIVQTFAVKVDVKEPPAYLRPGVTCDVSIQLTE
ncbi:MAG: HlyD family efflux transporter periplasmic adaptor subunit [Candidatus Omnitrophica bacterium]|nr:HlyD family efflux transporter periplasmic adaptor subunit [Candidatus Omnitrophota bacterium]